MGQTALAVGVLGSVATVFAVKMGTSYVWRSVRDALDGAWDELYDVADDDDDPDVEAYRELREKLGPEKHGFIPDPGLYREVNEA